MASKPLRDSKAEVLEGLGNSDTLFLDGPADGQKNSEAQVTNWTKLIDG